ncbi:MAG: peptidylprolyl isomerase [Pseudomonadota bacterium]|nr:peptidylprolyl isomerase [Pseudomonadota bacterium]
MPSREKTCPPDRRSVTLRMSVSDRFRGLSRALGRVLLASLLLGPSAVAGREPLDAIVAVVNDDVVMASELKRMVRRIQKELEQRGGEMPPDRVLNRQVLERLVLTKIQLQTARQTGVQVDDESLNRAMSNIAAENGMSLAQFRQAVESEGYGFVQFREDIRSEIMVSRLRQRQVDNLIHVSEREIDNYLATQARQEKIDHEYHLAQILVAVPGDADADRRKAARDKALAALKRLRQGEDFEQVAIAVSDDQEALDGGDLGWRRPGEIPAIYAGVVTSLREGGVSDLIESPNGYHIVKLIAVRGGGTGLVTETHARHILVKPDDLVSAEAARARLDRLRDRVLAGEDFAGLARLNSADKQSAAKGGDLGWMSPGDLVPKFEDAMTALEPGGVSEPFETEFGWHIVQVLERRRRDNTVEAMRAQAREAIRRRKGEEERQAWLRRLRDEAYVEYRLEE